MASRMQAYRARMKERGLMQVTVWAKPEHAAAIRAFSQQLLDDDTPLTDATTLQMSAGSVPPQAHVTGDLSGMQTHPTPHPGGTTGASPAVTGDGGSKPAQTSQVSGLATEPARIVTGDGADDLLMAVPDGPSAEALDEVAAEVENWDAELEHADELQRHEEVLQELRQWLKELNGSEPDMQRAIEQVLNSRRKRVKQLKRQRR